MIDLALTHSGGPLSILCMGAHADDIEIGCGGSVLRLLEERPGCRVRWVVFSGTDERRAEAEASAARFLAQAGEHRVDVHGFRDAHFPGSEAEMKEAMEAIRADFTPDVIFSHRLEDRHQDHRTLADLTWQAFRDHLILEYEIPKYEGDLGHPNCFVALAGRIRRQKVEHLMEGFPSQHGKPWFTPETFDGLMRVRGMESGAPEGYAEAFHVRKFLLGSGETRGADVADG